MSSIKGVEITFIVSVSVLIIVLSLFCHVSLKSSSNHDNYKNCKKLMRSHIKLSYKRETEKHKKKFMDSVIIEITQFHNCHFNNSVLQLTLFSIVFQQKELIFHLLCLILKRLWLTTTIKEIKDEFMEQHFTTKPNKNYHQLLKFSIPLLSLRTSTLQADISCF